MLARCKPWELSTRLARRFCITGWVGLSAALASVGCGALNTFHDRSSQDDDAKLNQTSAPRSLSAAPKDVGSIASKRPSEYTTRVGHYAFHSDIPLAKNDPIFRELEALPEQIETELQLPTSTNLIQVYLFDHEERYYDFLRAKDPKLPLRSAYFFAEPGRGPGAGPELHVYTWLGPRLRTDLRHELTHALLHGTLKAVPLWLDEGLAGFFEQPTVNDGLNIMHLDALVNAREDNPDRGPFQPDLARLEKLKEVTQMGRAEYQEAWAWVHYMLRGDTTTQKAFLAYLQQLRTAQPPPLLHAKLGQERPTLHQDMANYLQRLAAIHIPTTARGATPP